MTDPRVVTGTVVSGTPLDGSNADRNYARLRAFAVTLGLGPIVVLVLSFVLSRSEWPAAACVAFAMTAAAAARASRIEFLWARLD
ncbi:hypothetical protein [Streptomyces diastatochromogenes]|uniref:Uncharacterized protein n=1 Tax=Streptomyces diastatochromogenes TaxID=42236 RepID=A0A233SXZ9_STRDA|nr:hypothetical protein [Streptomyces diastatochromogenes]MCZ0991771.1 hypothetical protein [Streptomyces diastatochromogenes]OXZ00520.1 hypothetical protein BEK98_00145 [Streptomyces diastatochromogenes]